MSIFKREQEPPYNRAAAPKPAAASAPSTTAPKESASAAGAAPLSSGATTPATSSQPTTAGARSTSVPPVARDAAAVIDRQTEITGTLHSSGNVLIEGRFHGEVDANDTVLVEKGAQSDGQLRASSAVVSGAVDGQIECGRRLQIASTAVVSGEIKTPILVIEDGATVNCRFSMSRSGQASGGVR
jgi:cytoskeletal protein CcmA (bactofilin family)